MPFAMPIFDREDAWITPSLAVAILALIFTVASFWWIQVRRGRLRCYTSHVYSGSFSPSKLVLVVPLVLHNPAPSPLIVTDLRLRIDISEGRPGSYLAEFPMKLRWIASHTAVYPKNETRTFAAPFAVDGRKAVERFIEFQRNNPPSLLEDGPFKATVEALVEPRSWWTRRRWSPLLSYTFNSHLAGDSRASLIPRSNDPDLDGEGNEVWQ
ncbi:hypothetical protein GCM10029963_69240 [Micromonospora andamanensis]|uniref:hypothetical protein n=1 Tax=Micromonospora andamanensis TaxID=1287068 RepID=UPI00194F6C03|nr:hypothetical protein [Micromonospora andamanensis]GIJ38903.1 hypothetical protein Vwe01_22280 [Micromonospora andamanensis]